MGEPAEKISTAADDLEAQVQQMLALCGGDAVSALRASLIANAFLEFQIEELQAQTSAGYGRNRKT